MDDNCAVCRLRKDNGSSLTDRYIDSDIKWPGSNRIATSLVFNYQGSEAHHGDAKGYVRWENFTEREYGPKQGIWRVLRVLKEKEVRATFLVCGAIAEYFPETVLAIHAGGHEVAGHGYHHEISSFSEDSVQCEAISATLDILEKLTGRRPVGWRSCHQSPTTADLVMDAGLRYNTNTFIRDMPYLLTDGERSIVEIPRHPLSDLRSYGYQAVGGDPAAALAIWKGLFDTFYDESEAAPTFCPLSFHPYITGQPGRISALSRILDYIQEHDGVWMATSGEIADCVLDNAGQLGRFSALQDA